MSRISGVLAALLFVAVLFAEISSPQAAISRTTYDLQCGNPAIAVLSYHSPQQAVFGSPSF